MTTPSETLFNIVLFHSFRNTNPTALDHTDVFINKYHLVFKKDTDFNDQKRFYLGMCCNKEAGLLIKVSFFGFVEEVVKRALEEHRRVQNIFEKHPFSNLSAEDRAEQIREMRKSRLQGLKRDFVLKNIRGSSKEHIKKAKRLTIQPVNGYQSGSV